MNIREAIDDATSLLKDREITMPEREASSLLRFVIKCDAAFVYAHPEHQLNAMESILFKAVVKRRAAREPLQYIIGTQEFYGLEFEVSPDVLIPRPETELIVERAVKQFAHGGAIRLLEIGVGSGCISIALLKNLPDSTALGVDISEAAIGVAVRNAIKHDVADRIELNVSDVFENVGDEKFDLIVSNPPYIPTSDIASLQSEVKDHEPRTALDGGKDGLDLVKAIIAGSKDRLVSNGLLLMEIGIGQSDAVFDLFDKTVWQMIEFDEDLQGIRRMAAATRL